MMLIFLLSFLACPKPTDVTEPSEPEVSVEQPEAETQAIEAPHAEFVGTHSSPECGDRAYPRHIVLKDNMTYTLTDLVSPCPPGGMCAWSGVVTVNGSWSVEGPMVHFVEGKVDNGEQGAERPATLKLGQTGQLMEGRCVYAQTDGPVGPSKPTPPMP